MILSNFHLFFIGLSHIFHGYTISKWSDVVYRYVLGIFHVLLTCLKINYKLSIAVEKSYFFQKGKKFCKAILANNWENHKNAEFFKEKKL